jgi:hypothetical protein
MRSKAETNLKNAKRLKISHRNLSDDVHECVYEEDRAGIRRRITGK